MAIVILQFFSLGQEITGLITRKIAETKAIEISLLWGECWPKFSLELDALTIIQTINYDFVCHSKLIKLLSDVLNLFYFFTNIQVDHIYRENNELDIV